ncbi:hypothetical protein [Nonomuraea sp. NPDC050202]|uniref:hypothetical protein n=1 Tax=Nonomuraea sp. NPDC050202 TaxID=3155035 RepID=UPI00340BDA16
MGFLREKTTGFTGFIPTREGAWWKTMCLRGDRVAQVDQKTLVWEGPLAQVHNGALDLPEPFASCSEAALDLRTPSTITRHVFFAGDRCLDWQWGVGEKYEGPVTGLPDFGNHLPPAYRNDVDVAMQLPGNPWITMLIKGDRCALITWGLQGGVSYEGPLSGLREAGWKKLPAHMSGDFDQALLLPTTGTYQTIFIKGEQAMWFDWDAGPKVVGTYAQVMAGLGALPTDYRKLRLSPAGRFSGTLDDVRVELRIDLEGELPVVSGDTFTISKGEYLNSFVLDGTEPVTLPATITGVATFALPTEEPLISVAVDALAPGGVATFTRSGQDGTYPDVFTCSYVSRFLRTVDWEVDYVAGTRPPVQYATTTNPRPPGLAKKIITVQSAYADVGIEVRASGIVNEISIEEADTNLEPKAESEPDTEPELMWSNAELHAAMVKHFSGHQDRRQWKLWHFITTRHADKDGTRGIMFDFEGDYQRQGVATFYTDLVEQGFAGTHKELRTYVHEIGHALNLLHSFDKATAVPPQPLGPRNGFGDLSWMNYPHYYLDPDGTEDWDPRDPEKREGWDPEESEEAFWNVFPYRFSDNERRHLRHGFYLNVVMGGSKSKAGAADRPFLERFDPPPASRSGLRLELSGRESFSHGEPVVAEIKLFLDDSTSQAQAFPSLSPSSDTLTILVTDPAGAIRPFLPIARRCDGPDRRITLDAETPALYDSAYLGYGAGGLTFSEPGTYRLRALYRAPDGSTVTSPELTIEIAPPVDADDQRAGDLLRGSQQGTLLALLGSDAPQLAEGNAALDELIADHPEHPLAVYALMVKGTNAGRHFQTLTDDGAIGVRPADTDTSIAQLGTVVDTTLDPGTDAGVDNITLNATMRRLARAHARAGDLDQADAVLDQLVEAFRDKNVPAPVLATIAEQAETTRTQLHDQP